jgi:hypothetical protein
MPEKFMGQVLQLRELRGGRYAPPERGTRPARGSTYYCTRCGAERFVLAASGMVYCGPCGAWMRNITVAPAALEKPQPKA